MSGIQLLPEIGAGGSSSGLTAFVAAALLFSVQPLIGKMVSASFQGHARGMHHVFGLNFRSCCSADI